MEVKVEIYKNRMVFISGLESITVNSKTPFSSARLLIGSFIPALECMKQGLNEIGAKGLFKSRPNLKIHPKEMSEGGLSEVEERILFELADAAKAGKIDVVP